MNILIIDNNNIIVSGIKKIIEEHFKKVNFLVTTKRSEIFKIIKSKSVDLVILDVSEAGLGHNSLIKRIKSLQKKTKVLVTSDAHPRQDLILDYFFSGANGFLDKESNVEDLVLAINLILDDKVYLSNDMMIKLFSSSNHADTPLELLTTRELQVFNMIIQGYRIKDVSKQLNMHQSTASTLKKRILRKFKVNNLIHLKTKAMEYGY